MMDYIIQTFLQYVKENPDMLLDMLIALGEELDHQPKEKREKFLALLEKQMRKRIQLLEKNNHLLRERINRLEEELVEIKKQLFITKQNSI